MTWTTLHDKARQMGFELACHMHAAATRRDGSWIRVGSYDQVAELWAQPVTEQARALAPERVVAMISAWSDHVGTIADHGDEFRAHLAPELAAANHPEHGRMPA